MQKIINSISRACHSRSFGLLLIRVALGLVFVMHGWQKIYNIQMVGGMMVAFGLPFWVGIFIAYLEVFGGICIILGAATRFFGLVFGIEMLVAIYLTGMGTGYHAHELEIILALLSFGIAFTGSGLYSLYKMECEDCGGMLCNPNSPSCTKKLRRQR